MIDHLVHDADVINVQGDSYRLEGRHVERMLPDDAA
jgi:hypothetical protein